MDFSYFLQSYNYVFLIPIGLATFFIGFQVLGFGLGDFDGDADVDLDLDVDVDLDLDVDVDVDLDLDGDADVDLDGSLAVSGALIQTLSWFNVGKVPMSVLLMTLLYSFGFVGLVVTTAARERWQIQAGPRLLMLSLPLALVFGSLGCKFFGGFLGWIMPVSESKRMTRTRLVGREARVTSFVLDSESGRGLVEDDDGDLYKVFLKLGGDSKAPLAKGAKVHLTRYLVEQDLFVCRPVDKPDAAV